MTQPTRVQTGAAATRRDLEFSIHESILLPLPAATRKIAIAGPPGSSYRLSVTLTDAAAANRDADLTRTGGGVTVAGAGSVTTEYWPTATNTQKRVYIGTDAFLLLTADTADNPLDPPPAGDYQLFGYPAGRAEAAVAADNIFVPLVYGRLRLRARPHYFNSLDLLDEQLARLRDALTDAEAAPASSALVEVERADGSRDRYAGIGTLLAAIHKLEQRRDYLLATDHGRVPLAGFRLTA